MKQEISRAQLALARRGELVRGYVFVLLVEQIKDQQYKTHTKFTLFPVDRIAGRRFLALCICGQEYITLYLLVFFVY